ncbi:MAG: HAMP domain-containing histidine kinase [Oligoflexia bacterium]|nr:HAMP domain-containing histidine kinase [Oligoflexia bacterium]
MTGVKDHRQQIVLDARNSLEGTRARRFLVAQTSLLALALVMTTATNLTGDMSTLLVIQSYVFCAVVGVLTGSGWLMFLRRGLTTNLVVALLYVDSLLALVFFYVAGEFETPALALFLLCIVMAPVFAGRQHAWRMAFVQWLGYSMLLLLRKHDIDFGFLPYGYQLPKEAVNDPSFILDSWVSFSIAVGGMAYLAGRTSIDILNSQQQLEEEVAKKTAELSAAGQALKQANADLAQVNADLGTTNSALALTNDALETANKELRSGNARLQQFNYAVSHDLRTPIQALILRAEMLSISAIKDPATSAAMAQGIADTAARMGTLIDELLKLSRIDSRIADVEDVSLAGVLEMAIQDLQGRIADGHAEIRVLGALPVATGNPPLLHELVQNLLDNALKYGDSGGTKVRIEAVPAQAGYVAVAIEDNGSGVPPEDRDRIFGLFSRLDRDTKVQGMGAGLAIVQRIVEVHGGTIRVEDGRTLSGARFVLELPEA